MDDLIVTFGYLLVFIATGLVIPLIGQLARRFDWLDRPDSERKIHEEPIPNVGGIGIAVGVSLGMLYLFAATKIYGLAIDFPPIAFWLGAFLVGAAGFYDDTRGLDFRKKFVLQFLAAYVLLYAGYRFEIAQILSIDINGFQEALLTIPLSMLWIVGIINAVNLLDGLDGLAAGVGMIALVGLAFMLGNGSSVGEPSLVLVVVAALGGFLLYNFNPASIFMGDSGSLLLGYILATFSLESIGTGSPRLAVCAVVAVLALPLLDTTLAIWRRCAQGKQPFAADHDHIHHRLVQLFSQKLTVVILYGVQAIFVVGAIAIIWIGPAVGFATLSLASIGVGVGLWWLGYVRVPIPDTREWRPWRLWLSKLKCRLNPSERKSNLEGRSSMPVEK